MNRRLLLKVTVVLVLGAVFAAIWFSPLREQLTRDNIRAFVEQLRDPWYGPAVFMAVFALGCVFALPASLFVIAAGLIWGWLGGAVYSIVGGLTGAIASFYVGRFVGEGLLARFGRLGAAVARQVDHAGFRSLLVLRFIPGIPFAVLNYGAGVTGVRFRDFALSTFIGMTPPMFVFAYSADALFNGSLSEGDAVGRLVLVFALMLAVMLLPQLVKRFAKRPPAVE